MSPELILADTDYLRLKQYVLDQTGLHYYADKDAELAKHISRRATTLQLRTCTAYLNLLANPAGQGEKDNLVKELTIGETYFFRQKEHFDLLREVVIPDLMRRNASTHRLRIWSAGCATGAEPYSLAILLGLEFGGDLHNWDVSIVGTDFNRDYLELARQARFGKWALREVSEELRATCFDSDGDLWRVKSEYRRLVRFEYHNLADDQSAYPGQHGDAFDLIVCRNVLIYFSRDRIQQVANRMYVSLIPDGWLLVGHAEPNTEIFSRFSLRLFADATAYRRPPRDGEVQIVGLSNWAQHIDAPAPPLEIEPPPVTIAKRVYTAPEPQTLLAPEVTHDEIRRLADSGRWQDAERECRHHIASKPLDASLYLTLGLILEHVSSDAETQATFRRAIYLDRSLALAHYHLGVCLMKNTDTKGAAKSFQNVITLLAGKADGEPLQHGDQMTVAELRDLVTIHVDAVAARGRERV